MGAVTARTLSLALPGCGLALLLAAAGLVRAQGAPAPESPAALLRDARAKLAAGEAAAAAERFAAVAESTPEVADHAAELRVEALVAAGAHAAALAAAAEFRARHAAADPWLLSRVAAHEGAAHVALGDEPAARAAFERALAGRSEGDAERPRLLAEIAASFARSGDAAAAAERWRTLYTRFATSPEAVRAEQELAGLAGADASFAYRTPEALAERCRRLSAALRNEEAIRECDAALALAPGDRGLLRERAELRFRTRRYGEAVDAFAALGPGDAEARFWRARSLARSGRIEESLAAFEQIAAGRDRELAARARFLAGTLHEDDDLAAAEASYRIVAGSAPLASQRSAARWRLAWLAWRRGEVEAAAAALERFVADEPDPAERLRGRYWYARALDRLGRPEGRERLAELVSEGPLSYYGWRAATRLGDGAAPARDVAAAPAAAATPDLPPALARRFQILLEAGLDERAAREIRPLASRAPDRATRLALAQLLLEAGQFHRAQRLVLDAHAEELVGTPPPGAEALWWLAWPTAFDRAVERAAREAGIEPALVYAIMREESGYQPDALSVVGARGLTQIMPDTGRRLAADLGAARFDASELFVPERNLQLGAFYLAQLLQRFDGRASAAIASYNAGPEAVARWLAAGGGSEDDEWVEGIPYDQTRSYVKRVLRSLHVYRTLYGS
jgi:soluble lytic murein transglycosylase